MDEIIGQLKPGQIINPIIKIVSGSTYAVWIQCDGFWLYPRATSNDWADIDNCSQIALETLMSLRFIIHGKVQKIPFGVRMNYVI
jgi:hypothetical protein